jgi:isopenicillin-N epimerase
MRFGRHMLEHWSLDPEVTYLNHGTVGVVPRRVQAYQQRIRDEMEREPARFVLREVVPMAGGAQGPGRLRRSAEQVAAFFGAKGSDFAFVDNVTAGASAVLHSLSLEPGDEILLTDHAYGAVARVAAFVARERRANVKTIPFPYPEFDAGRLIDAIAGGVTPRTRVLVIDHITAESAIVLPVADIAARVRSKGILVLVDGAHAPGHVAFDLPSLGVDFYTANLHKWAHAPRGCGFLWAAPEHHKNLHPPVVSWYLDQGFPAEFDWVGTRDPSPFLSAPEGLAFLRDLDFDAVRAYGHDLARRSAQMLAARWGSPFLPHESWYASMVTLPLPERLGSTPEQAMQLRDALLFEDRIEVQVHARYGRIWLRICGQVYNDDTDVARLADAVARRIPKV